MESRLRKVEEEGYNQKFVGLDGDLIIVAAFKRFLGRDGRRDAGNRLRLPNEGSSISAARGRSRHEAFISISILVW